MSLRCSFPYQFSSLSLMHANSAACLGKVPTHGDFVSHRASTPTMRSFDRWIREGLYHARQHQGPNWESTYDEAPTMRFLFWGQGRDTPNALLGVLRSSRDEGGRTYPFVVTCEVPKHALSPHHFAYLPIQASSFYEAAVPLVRQATEGAIPYRDVPKRLDDVMSLSVQPTVPHEHKRYLQRKTIGGFLEALFGHFEDSGKYQLFSNLFDILLPLQNQAPPQLDYGVQFPLGAGEEGPSNVVSFWLDVVLRVLDYPSVQPSIFWADSEAEADDDQLLLYMGAPDPSAFFDILAPQRANGRIYSLRSSGAETTAEAALSIPEEYGELLENKQVRLWDFLNRL